ncbi:hypothetical protein BH18ACT7_BH18ACT7_01620 [soil metagenome]
MPTASTRPATSDPTAAFFGVRNPPVITRMKYGPVVRYQSAGLTAGGVHPQQHPVVSDDLPVDLPEFE